MTFQPGRPRAVTGRPAPRGALSDEPGPGCAPPSPPPARGSRPGRRRRAGGDGLVGDPGRARPVEPRRGGRAASAPRSSRPLSGEGPAARGRRAARRLRGVAAGPARERQDARRQGAPDHQGPGRHGGARARGLEHVPPSRRAGLAPGGRHRPALPARPRGDPPRRRAGGGGLGRRAPGAGRPRRPGGGPGADAPRRPRIPPASPRAISPSTSRSRSPPANPFMRSIGGVIEVALRASFSSAPRRGGGSARPRLPPTPPSWRPSPTATRRARRRPSAASSITACAATAPRPDRTPEGKRHDNRTDDSRAAPIRPFAGFRSRPTIFPRGRHPRPRRAAPRRSTS